MSPEKCYMYLALDTHLACVYKYARIPWAPFVNTAYLDEGKRPFAFLRSLTTGLQRNPKSTTGTAYLRLVNIGFQILGAASGTFVTASAAYLLSM